MRINYRHRAFIRMVGVARLKLFRVVDRDSPFQLHTGLSEVDFVVFVIY